MNMCMFKDTLLIKINYGIGDMISLLEISHNESKINLSV
jgi:hypothetical protein